MPKMTTSEFKKRIKTISPSIEVLGDYNGSLEHIECKCKVCGNVWKPLATTLSLGR